MGNRQTSDIVVNALVMAIARRSPDGDLIHHADRGAQYTAGDYMATGAGVFATGDLDSLGLHMCGRLPRVKAAPSDLSGV